MFNDINSFVLQDTVTTMPISQSVINAKKIFIKKYNNKVSLQKYGYDSFIFFSACV